MYQVAAGLSIDNLLTSVPDDILFGAKLDTSANGLLSLLCNMLGSVVHYRFPFFGLLFPFSIFISQFIPTNYKLGCIKLGKKDTVLWENNKTNCQMSFYMHTTVRYSSALYLRVIRSKTFFIFVFCVGPAVTHRMYCSLSRLIVLTLL
jgi:hypothetical protein